MLLRRGGLMAIKSVLRVLVACAAASFGAVAPSNATVLLPMSGIEESSWQGSEVIQSFFPMLMSVVPESAIWVMMLIGFGCIGWALRNAPIINPPE
jgi:hypothetical protein